MKKKFLLPMLFLGVGATLQAQVILEETFDYTAGDPIVAGAEASADNYDETTGWYTQNNSDAGTSTFTVSETALEYPGYALSGVGKGITYDGLDGQDLFKPFDVNVTQDSTLYLAFMIHFPSAVQQASAISGSDVTIAAKMGTAASDVNYGCRMYAAYYSDYPGEEVSYGINKLSSGTTTWVSGQSGPWYPADETQLVVLKHYVGFITGDSSTEEAGTYDDEMYIYVNPVMTSEADNTPMLTHIDATQKDAYRWGSSSIFGGLSALFFRSNASGGTAAFQVSGVRAALSWEDLFEGSSEGAGIQSATTSQLAVSVSNGALKVSESYDNYELYSVSGATIATGTYESTINVSGMQSGVYLLKLTQGTQQTVTKVVL